MRPWKTGPSTSSASVCIIAGVLFMYFLNFVGIIIGLIMIIGGIMALWMTYRRKKYGTA